MSNDADRPFWQVRTLAEMTPAQWESLCDGCAKCCLIKLIDEQTGALDYTNIACRLLDLRTCRCTDYPNRQTRVPGCVVLTPETVEQLSWMPETCAYRLLSEGRDLPWWHPLNSGDRRTVHDAGVSARGLMISEVDVEEEDWPDHIVEFIR